MEFSSLERERTENAPAARCRILALAPNFWDDQWMNRQQILSRLAKHHDVLYSNGPWSAWDRHHERFRTSSWTGSFEARDGVLVDRPSKLLLSWPTHPAADRAAASLAVARWRRQLARMGNGPIVAYLFHPTYLRYAERLHPDFLIYSPYDLFSRMPGWTAEQSANEQRLLELCTLVITSSEPTRAALQPKTDKPVFCVPNGADAAHFEAGSKQPPPPDLASIPRPRIGYVGSVNRKIDFALIASLALREPGWQFVFIGPEGNLDDLTRMGVNRCKALTNVHFLPSRPVSDLPRCMGGLDVGLLCYRRDTWMEFGFPLKLFEYLAAGLPVVSKPLPSVMDHREFLELAEDESSWHDAIAKALNGHGRSTPEARRAEAWRNTWDSRVATIDHILSAAARGTLSHPPPLSAGVNAA
jgi:glycosyltransferase involved in cell wall biosynthesis